MSKKKVAEEVKRKMAHEVAKMKVLVAIREIREVLPRAADYLRNHIICNDKEMELLYTENDLIVERVVF